MVNNTPDDTTLAQRIDAFFRAPGREYTFAEVAAGIRRQGGPTVAGTQLWELRHGVKTSPRLGHLVTLARFFGEPIRYFFPDDDLGADLYTKLHVLHALRDPRIERIALRARQIEGVKDAATAPEDQAERDLCAGRADPPRPLP